MNTANEGTRKAIILWLSGLRLEDIHALPEVENLRKSGTQVELEASPITGSQAQQYQAFMGVLPAQFGFFDPLVPLWRHSQASRDEAEGGYAVIEESAGMSTPPKALPDLLRAAGWTVEYEEVIPSEFVVRLRALTQTTSPSATCIIVKCAIDSQSADLMSSGAVEEAVSVARTWVGETGLLALLSDTRPAAVRCFVNLNNFLAEMGVMERDEQSGLINWPNSLAYFLGNGQLWINLLGRDPQGSVHPQDEYEEVRDTLVQALPNKLRDPETGEQVIERIYRKEELYPDKYLFCAPDLIVVFKPGYAPSPQSTLLKFDAGTFTLAAEGSTATAGVHPSVVGGFLLLAASAAAHGVSVSAPAPLVAAVPTLLHALGVRYTSLDGQPIADLFSPAYLTEHPIDAYGQEQGLSEEDEELVINRLRDLGYI